MKESFVLAVKLFILSAVSALVLAVVYHQTTPIIENRAREQYQKSLKEVFKEADKFNSVETAELTKMKQVDPQIEDVAIATKGGQPIGWTVKALGKGGYGGPIEIVIGIDKDKKITGFTVLKSSETPGIGDKIQKKDFIDAILGKSVQSELTAVPKPSGENEIQAISGATYSTTGVLNGLNAAVHALEQLK